MTRPWCVAVLAAALFVSSACGDDDTDDAVPPTSLDTDFVAGPEPLAVTDLGEVDPGTARVVLGGTLDATFRLGECELADDDPIRLVTVDGTAALAGVTYRLEIRRFRTEGEATTITDTVTVYAGPSDAPVGALQAQRVDVNTIVTDPREPEADSLILQIGDDVVLGQAIFANPGSFADDGNLVEGSFLARC